jgi:Protein of unknown function (DUF3987)
VADWVARHPGRIARLAGLLQLARFSGDKEIRAEVMDDALSIGAYLLDHALAVLTGPDALTRRALQWLAANNRPTVTLRELMRGPLGSRGTSEDALALADSLTEYGALRPITVEHVGPGRPPSPSYEVNPSIRGSADRTDKTPAEPEVASRTESRNGSGPSYQEQLRAIGVIYETDPERAVRLKAELEAERQGLR